MRRQRGDNGEESRSSNFSKNPDGWDTHLVIWDEIKYVMESRGLTLKQKEKKILNMFINIAKFSEEWDKDPTYIRVINK